MGYIPQILWRHAIYLVGIINQSGHFNDLINNDHLDDKYSQLDNWVRHTCDSLILSEK